MNRICSWCVPNHMIGVKCDSCGSTDCVQAVGEQYWLCVDCGTTFTDKIITSGICPDAAKALKDRNKAEKQSRSRRLSIGQSWCLMLAIDALVWIAVVKIALWAVR